MNDNLLTHLPPDIGNLVNLETLDLYENKLNVLPSEIGNLVNLTTLVLGSNPLVSLPPSIGNLSNLKFFQMLSTPLKEVPVEFWSLCKLEKIDLRQTSIAIPSSIDRLKNLQYFEISLEKNLPEEFGNLASLTRLILVRDHTCTDSCTMQFPSSMANLQNLEEFRLCLQDGSEFDIRQLGFLRKLPKISQLFYWDRPHVYTDDERMEFMKNLILDTPSLRRINYEILYRHPKIKYVLLHNCFKHRTSFGCGTKAMSALVYKLWPQMLSNASQAFYAKGNVDTNPLLMDRHDAVYQLLNEGMGSFVGMLRNRSSGNHNRSKNHVLTMRTA